MSGMPSQQTGALNRAIAAGLMHAANLADAPLDVLEARRRVAAQYHHAYHKHAIMGGHWDHGLKVRAALAEVAADKRAEAVRAYSEDDGA
jgi:hypothetical protein